jgi:hypothetical protein
LTYLWAVSAKIYSGYIVDSRFSQAEIEKRFQATRKALRKEANRLYSRFVGDGIAEMATAQQLFLKKPRAYAELLVGSSFLSAANLFLIQERDRNKKESSRFPEHDLDCFWTLYHITTKSGKTRTLCYLSTEQATFHKIFKKLAPVREYAYWNNTDRPDHLSQRAWDERGDSWTLAYRQAGWRMGVFDEMYDGPDMISGKSRNLFVANLNRRHTRFARARRQVISDIENNTLSVNVAISRATGEGEMAMHEMSRVLYDTWAWMKTPEGRKEINRDARIMAKQLRPFTVAYISRAHVPFANGTGCPVFR